MAEPIVLQGCVVDLEARAVVSGGQSTPLTEMEVALLVHIAAQPGQVASRADLEQSVWGFAPGVRSEAVPVAVRRLRRKLEPGGEPVNLLTVRGVGWRLAIAEPVVPTVTPPQGTVTLVVTDIQGSTALWEQNPAAMEEATALHDALLRESAAATGGYVFRSEGDALLLAFADPREAVGWCLMVQRRLSNASWPDATGALMVRMGACVGVPEVNTDAQTGRVDYRGPLLLRSEAICDAAHGGQVLLSAALPPLLGADFPATLTELGAVRIGDLRHPEPLVDAQLPDTPRQFPPPRGQRRTNLRPPATPLLARDADRVAVKALLDDGAQLVSLLGTGGIGKTRLAMDLGHRHLDDFPGGVWAVDLLQERTAAGVRQRLAEAVGASLLHCRSAAQERTRLAQVLSTPAVTLLILDNLEHLLDESTALLDALLAVPKLRVLVTSRVRLQHPAEHVHELSPLATSDGAALFIACARSSRARFQVDARQSAAIDAIVEKLDGLPLAIELAAARSRMLSPVQLLSRLDHRLRLLRGRTSDRRHATMRATIAWSWELLDAETREALRQCAVFRGSFTVDGAEAVLTVADPLESLEILRDHSLLQSVEGDDAVRFRMLETVREFALEQPGSHDAVQARHAAWAVQTAEALLPHTRRRDGQEQVDRLGALLPELTAAAEHMAAPDPQLSARAALCAGAYYRTRGPRSAGVGLLEQTTTLTLPDELHVQVELSRIYFLMVSGRIREAEAPLLSLLARREIMPAVEVSRALSALASVRISERRREEGLELLDEARAVAAAAGAAEIEGIACYIKAIALQQLGDDDGGHDLIAQSVALLRRAGDDLRLCQALMMLGASLLDRGALDRGRVLLEEAVQIADLIGQPFARSRSRLRLALAWLPTSPFSARHLIETGLQIVRQDRDPILLDEMEAWQGLIFLLSGAPDAAIPRLEASIEQPTLIRDFRLLLQAALAAARALCGDPVGAQAAIPTDLDGQSVTNRRLSEALILIARGATEELEALTRDGPVPSLLLRVVLSRMRTAS